MNERKTAMITKKSRMPASSGRKYICVIADYGPVGDMAFAEVQQTLYAILRDSEVTDYKLDLTNVPAFDTYATGFKLAQLALNSALGEDHVFYVNTAPRKDKKSARINNEGEGLVYVQLNNGVHIVAVNSGYSLTFIKPFAKTIRELKVDKAGSQFRSRDIFPQAVGAILRGDMSILGKDVTKTVPGDIPKNRVLYTDGYGNMKTSVDPKDLKKLQGQQAYVSIGDSENIAVHVGTGIFAVPDGDFCFARGSSGWKKAKGTGRQEFAEIVCRGGSAAAAFGHPVGGKVILWKKIPH